MIAMFRECLCYLLAALIFLKFSEIVLPCHNNNASHVSSDFTTIASQTNERGLRDNRIFEWKQAFGRFGSHRRQRLSASCVFHFITNSTPINGRRSLNVRADVSLSPEVSSFTTEEASLSSLALTTSSWMSELTTSAPPVATIVESTGLPGEVVSESTVITAGTSQSAFTSLETLTSTSSLSDSSFSSLPITPYASSSITTSTTFPSPSETFTSSFSSRGITSLSTSAGDSSTSLLSATGSSSSEVTSSIMSDTTSATSESSSIFVSSSTTSAISESTSFLSSSAISSSVGIFPTSSPLSSVSASLSSVVLSSVSRSSSASSRVTSSRTSSTSTSFSSSRSSSISSTSSFSRSLVTVFTTSFVTKTIFDHHTTTIAVAGTGVLGTDTPKNSSFARNTGAIVGVAVSAALFLIALIFIIFFGCKRYKAQKSEHGSLENILAIARETAWRAPLDGDDSDLDSHHESRARSGSLPRLGASSQGHGSTGTDGGTMHTGDHLSSEGGRGSAETANAEMPTPLTPPFGGQPYMPGHVHVRPPGGTVEMTETRWNSTDSQIPQIVNQPTGGSRSAISLTVLGGSSSNEHGVGWSSSSSADHHARSLNNKRLSLSGPRPMPVQQQKDRRHKSTPPSAFPTTTNYTFDIERQQDQSDKNSIKGFFNRLRGGRKISNHSTSSTLGGMNADQLRARGSDETVPDLPSLFSPSLLNPPVSIPPPSQALLYFPRGVTGRGYANPTRQPFHPEAPGTSTVMWPPLTLPPSPDPTENSRMAEGLLHPRLGKRSSGHEQASMTSLGDHEDYSRPISGLISNHIRSTTTFDTTLGNDDVDENIGVAS